jgi:hypothetical protein
MCPACVATAALIAAGAIGKGRLASLTKWLRSKVSQSQTSF